MVYLNRIYTRTGDAGETSLGNGERVAKTHPRIAAYGGVDELNSVIGVALTQPLPEAMTACLTHVQNDLFDLGADLCVPETDSGTEPSPAALRITAGQTAALERWIDEFNASLPPLKSFVLPGGSAGAAMLHHARAVCRRVELGVLALMETEPVNPQTAVYLNRLSDLLFVLARAANDNGAADVLWVPGQHRSES